jgi:hypothetical protein
MNRYIAALIDTMNRGDAIQELTRPAGRIRQMLELYRSKDPGGAGGIDPA